MVEYIQLYQWEWVVFGFMIAIYIWQRHRSVVLLSGMGIFCTSLSAVLHSLCMYFFPNLPYMFISFPMVCVATLWWIWFWATIKPLFWQAFSFFCMVVPVVCIFSYGTISTDYIYTEHKEHKILTFAQLNEADIGDIIRISDGLCRPAYTGSHTEIVVKNQTTSTRHEVSLFTQKTWSKDLPVTAWISSKNLHPYRDKRTKQCQKPMLLTVEPIYDGYQQAIGNAIHKYSLKRGKKITLLRRVKEKSELLESLQSTRKGLLFSIIVSIIGFVVKVRIQEPEQKTTSIVTTPEA